MIYNFNVKLTSTSLSKPYDYIHNFVSGFINKISGYIQGYNYKLINKIDDGGNPVLTGTAGRNSWTSVDEATKFKAYSYDFWIYKDDILSRTCRITAKLATNAKIFVGICNIIPAKKPEQFFRGVDIAKDGRTYLFGDYLQMVKPAGNTIRRNTKTPNWSDKNNIFNCKITVNDELILIHGKLESDNNQNYLMGNYLSYIKCFNLYKIEKFVMLCNGLYGYYDKKVDIAPAITQRKPQGGGENYARLGIQLKIRTDRNTTFEYGTHRIMLFPKVNNYIQSITDEPYKVYFEDLYREDNSFFGLIDSISGITNNLCLIVD